MPVRPSLRAATSWASAPPTPQPFDLYGDAARFPPPATLSDARVAGALIDFGHGDGDGGSGIHLGAGLILTARHVIEKVGRSLPSRALPDARFAGRLAYDAMMPGRAVRFLPEPGSYNRYARSFQLDLLAARGDWALMEWNDASTQPGAALRIRKASTLAPGERVWVLGDNTAGRTRAATGVFDGIDGVTGKLRDAALEGGFSGSPVLDGAGRLVGILYGTTDDGTRRGYFVTAEAIAAEISASRTSDPALAKLLTRMA